MTVTFVDTSPYHTLEGPSGNYHLYSRLSPWNILQIHSKTRKVLPLPIPPDRCLQLVTPWDKDPKKFSLGRSAFGVLCIGRPSLDEPDWLAAGRRPAPSQSEIRRQSRIWESCNVGGQNGFW